MRVPVTGADVPLLAWVEGLRAQGGTLPLRNTSQEPKFRVSGNKSTAHREREGGEQDKYKKISRQRTVHTSRMAGFESAAVFAANFGSSLHSAVMVRVAALRTSAFGSSKERTMKSRTTCECGGM